MGRPFLAACGGTSHSWRHECFARCVVQGGFSGCSMYALRMLLNEFRVYALRVIISLSIFGGVAGGRKKRDVSLA
eukprot:636230-Amphidinium_carterae.1